MSTRYNPEELSIEAVEAMVDAEAEAGADDNGDVVEEPAGPAVLPLDPEGAMAAAQVVIAAGADGPIDPALLQSLVRAVNDLHVRRLTACIKGSITPENALQILGELNGLVDVNSASGEQPQQPESSSWANIYRKVLAKIQQYCLSFQPPIIFTAENMRPPGLANNLLPGIIGQYVPLEHFQLPPARTTESGPASLSPSA